MGRVHVFLCYISSIMLKRRLLAALPWLIAVAVTIGTAVAVAREQHRAREEYQAQSEAECAALAISPEEKHACAKEAQDRKDYTEWWDVLFTWPEGITTWAIIATGFAIAWQSNETHKAARAAEEAAKVVLKQTDYMANSERAWLTISAVNKDSQELQPNDPPLFFWEIRNVGKTPARLVETQGICCVTEQKPARTQMPAPVVLNERILAPGDSMEFHTYWTTESGGYFHDRVDSLVVVWLAAYGYVKYRTVFRPDPCESWFCEDFFHSQQVKWPWPKIVFRPNLEAPPEYTKHT